MIFNQYNLKILAYHSVSSNRKDALAVTPQNFEKQMDYLHKKAFNIISLDKCVEFFKQGRNLLKKTVCITFDDGYKDNYENAFPILKKYKFPATIFLITDLIGTNKNLEPELFIEKYGRNQEDYACLTWEEIKKMQSHGISFGSHTLTHSHLTEIPMEIAKKEIKDSKTLLEMNLLKKIEYFCYPAGYFNEEIIKIVQDTGYKGAVITPNHIKFKNSLFTLKRIGIYRHDNIFRFKIKISSLFTIVRKNQLLLYILRGFGKKMSRIYEK